MGRRDVNKFVRILDVFQTALRCLTPEKSPTGKRLVFSVYAKRVMGGGATKIRSPSGRGVVSEGAWVDEKFAATITQPKANAIRMSMSVEGRKPQRSCIEYDQNFIFPTPVRG